MAQIEKHLVDYCRFYNYQTECPYDPTDERSMLWKIEYLWVKLNTQSDGTETIRSCMQDYINAGLYDFCSKDSIPVSFKSVLFNRYTTYNERVDIEGFKALYAKYYA